MCRGLFMKKYNIFLLLMMFILGACSSNSAKPNGNKTPVPTREIDNRFSLHSLGSYVSIHTELQQTYIDEDDVEAVPKEADGNTELSRPENITLSWEIDDKNIKDFVVGIGEEEDLSDQKEYEVSDTTSLDVTNLKIGTKYYWTVKESGSDIMSEAGSFTTIDEGPRNIYISGMTNCRDIGGYYTSYGGRVRQGFMYRTGNSDKITEDGKKTMLDLGMKTEIDLRDVDYKSESPAGNQIKYYSYRMFYDDYSNYVERNCESLKSTLRLFANEDNYPIFYHCRIGTDRTGFTTYLLLGLLGVDEEDIYRDYLFSNFGVIEDTRTLHGSGVNNVQLYYDAINAFPGETLQERVYNFLIGIGLTEDELDSIIELNIEGVRPPEVLKGYRPLNMSARQFFHSDDLSVQTYINSNSSTSVDYYALNKNINSYVGITFTPELAFDVDIYCYMYAPSGSLSIKACDAFRIELNNEALEVTTKTFRQLHCRATAGIYVCAMLASASLQLELYNLRITNISTANNESGLGANIASIVVIPH